MTGEKLNRGLYNVKSAGMQQYIKCWSNAL